MDAFTAGVITGVLASIVGSILSFYLTYLYDKRRRQDTGQSILNAFREETIGNLEMLSANANEIEKELEAIKNGDVFVSGLSSYQFATWDLIKLNLPARLSDEVVLRQLSSIMHLVLLINTEINSRETYKVTSGSMPDFINHLKARNTVLMHRHVKLLNEMLSLARMLEMNLEFSSPCKTLMDSLNKSNEHKS